MHGTRKAGARLRKPALVAILAAAVAGVAVASAVAANVVGTAGKDTLRGSSKADKMFGKSGNDKLFGLGGNDYLNGGPGNDLLVGGPGADVLVCGPGRDVAMADARDKVGKDCEVVKGVAKPTLSVNDASIQEGNSGSQAMAFTVKLSKAATSQVTVAYATADGSATAVSDYTAANGTLVFAPGETSKTLSVSVLGDTAVEADETFTLALSSPAGATLARGSATGTIRNDDTAAKALPGNYCGNTVQGPPLCIQTNPDATAVVSARTSSLVDCTQPVQFRFQVTLGFSGAIAIQPDLSFSATYNGPLTGGGGITNIQTSYFIRGVFTTDGKASGQLAVSSLSFDYAGYHFVCSQNPVDWSVTKQG